MSDWNKVLQSDEFKALSDAAIPTPPTDTDSMSRGEARWRAAFEAHCAAHPAPNQHDDFLAGWNAHAALSHAQSEAGERESFLGAMGGADYDDFRSAALRSNPGVSTPPKDSEAAATNGELAKALTDLERSIELHEEAKPCDPWIELHVDDARCILTALGAKP